MEKDLVSLKRSIGIRMRVRVSRRRGVARSGLKRITDLPLIIPILVTHMIFSWMLEERIVFFNIPFLLGGVILSLVLFRIKNRRGLLRKDRFSGFECGFDQVYRLNRGFCVRFFNLAILFLFVDLEIALIIPFFRGCLPHLINPLLPTIILFRLFIFLLLILIVEILFGGVKWSEEI